MQQSPSDFGKPRAGRRISPSNRYVIAGGGGYPNLYPLSESGTLPQNTPLPGVILEKYCDNRNGYLLMEVTAQTIKGEYFTVPRYAQPDNPPQQFDTFTLDSCSCFVSHPCFVSTGAMRRNL
jgi:hypothetical protein